ncbi:hypothetical protein SUNI508_12892 [Seiridium unicorne]|uniref:Uncharacterized protein n=1 Tax=Seiridium unicorne TaxID=138068 RepID=A0ABR2VG21_9PEZI
MRSCQVSEPDWTPSKQPKTDPTLRCQMRQPRQVGSALQGLAHSEPDRAASALLIVVNETAAYHSTSVQQYDQSAAPLRPPLSIGEQGEVARWPMSPPGWIGIWRRLYEFNGSAMWSSVTIIIVVAIVNPEYYNVQISKERRIDQKSSLICLYGPPLIYASLVLALWPRNWCVSPALALFELLEPTSPPSEPATNLW